TADRPSAADASVDLGIAPGADPGLDRGRSRDDGQQAHARAVEAFADRMLSAALATTDFLAAYLGDRLGWYRDLALHGAATAAELAERTGTAPRYALEWLEQQAVSGVLDVVQDAAGDAAARRFVLP